MSATAVKERPILFSGPMVKAILAGTKTQTRRIVKPQPREVVPNGGLGVLKKWVWDKDGSELRPGHPLEWLLHNKCPFGWPGDRLWVREKHAFVVPDAGVIANPRVSRRKGMYYGTELCSVYATDCKLLGWDDRWRPSIHMPRWASRITLEIVSVRVERLREISEADAIAEGCPECPQCLGCPWGRGALDDELSNAAGGRPWSACFGRCDGLTAKQWFKSLWQSINGPGSWDANPFVWVVEFKRLPPCAP